MKFLILTLLTCFSPLVFALDAVTTNVIAETRTHYVVHLTNISDSTGESAVIKVDKSAIAVASDGAEAASLDIDEAQWSVTGFTNVRILWDHTTDDLGMVMAGTGRQDFRGKGNIPGIMQTAGLKDPRSSGGTGDILLTTAGSASGNTYDITLWLRKNPN